MSGLVGGLFGSTKSSGNSASQTNSTTVNPPAYLQPFLQNAANNSQNAYANYIAQGLNAPFTGQQVTDPANLTPQATPSDIAGENTALGVANGMNGQQGNTNGIASNLQSEIANGMFQHPANQVFQPMSDQNLQASIAAQIAPLKRQLVEQTLPTLTSNAINQGAYGGSKAGVVNNRALMDFDTSAANATADATEKFDALNSTLSEQNLANRIAAGVSGNAQTLTADSLVPTLQNAGTQQGLTQAGIQSGVGATQRGFTANNIAAEMQAYAGLQGEPFGGLGTLEQLLQGTNSGSTSTKSVPNPGLLAQLTAGAGGLSSIASILGGSSGLSSIFGSSGLGSFLGAGGADAAGTAAEDAALSAFFI